ncbi:GNAT family N-acetyltransferase [Phytoactinopolyspora limicola]|uniref:GNAT family N-acetyltransferase n=1 Tax=Phytoactinopolyspora limicola TaxID=2715536 RepID=UPI00140C3399|nr:GNAT family N-acetyltransferase [Phytoactinopolyspora limicola]
MEPSTLTSDRVLLSPPGPDDVERIAQLCQDPLIQEWTTVPVPYTLADALTFVTVFIADGWSRGTALTWAIREPSTGRVDGMIGVDLSGDGKAEIGFWLDPAARGQGMMAHAVRLVAEHVFSRADLGVTHMMWWAYVGNWPSRRVAWATGFRYEGMVRGGEPQRGQRRDAWVATLRPGEPMAPASPWLDVPTIHGERLSLRPFEDTDVDNVTEACSDPTTQYWASNLPNPYTSDDASRFIHRTREDAATGSAVHWATTLPAGGPSVATFALRLLGPHNDQATIGYLVHPKARRLGIATEGLQMVVRHAFIPVEDGGLGLRRLMIQHAEGNEGSRKVIERAGFRYIGVERGEQRLSGGTTVDGHRYDLLPDDLP